MKQLVTYPKPEQKEKIERAAVLVGLKVSSFLTSCAYKEALIILKENSEGCSN